MDDNYIGNPQIKHFKGGPSDREGLVNSFMA